MLQTSGQGPVQTTLETFQDLDLCSKTVIMDVVGYIGMQQLKKKDHSGLDLTSVGGAEFLPKRALSILHQAVVYVICRLLTGHLVYGTNTV